MAAEPHQQQQQPLPQPQQQQQQQQQPQQQPPPPPALAASASSGNTISSSAAVDSFYDAERYAEVQRRLERGRIQPVFGRDAGGGASSSASPAAAAMEGGVPYPSVPHAEAEAGGGRTKTTYI